MDSFEMQIGYSTGAVALGDFQLALTRLSGLNCNVIEVSALRTTELAPLVRAFPTLELSKYHYVAFHAPSKFGPEEDAVIVEEILKIEHLCHAVVVHPDTMHDFEVWKLLGAKLCFENMDKRKRVGRYASELDQLFGLFPDAGLCLDLGHVWQIDKTMTEARQMLHRFSGKIRQLHVSEVDTRSRHLPITLTSVTAFAKVFDLLPNVPWILEAITAEEQLAQELNYVRDFYSSRMNAMARLITD